MATEQNLTPNGAILNETGDFEALTPNGVIANETISTTSVGGARYYYLQQQ